MQILNTRTKQTSKKPLGKWVYEKQLLNNLDIQLQKLLAELNAKAFTKKAIMLLYTKKVTKDNIIKIHSHPIKSILYHLLDDDLEILETYTEVKYTTKTK